MSLKTELVIFDWDGTLYNSVGQIVASLQHAAEQHELPLTNEAAKSIIGLGLPEVMQTLFPEAPELHDSILKAYGDHYIANSTNDAWFDGVAELLHDLKAQGLKLAVATGKNRRGLDRVIAKTQSTHLFDVTRAANETRSKPDPLMLQEILTVTGVSVERAVMIGDSSYDLEMAQRLNMPRIGVGYGVHSVEVLQQFKPLTIAKDVQELHRFLNGYAQLPAIDLV
ncbi:HAD family hydrolase [Acinetobacter calcoaceticus]|jgi:phosphoglycolate phosphatase|uniref:HAD family hydrolase n=1 Tax=Acinetobacter oleivorans TaxID=1148157 RepID=A0A0B2UGF3_9GAMM|nr:HAD-IA family hydrolase [Acinetobacter calcoaceticus]KHN68443.1 HAD family hydrolase [Acinetobacter oleivorans]KUM12876.1 HAD family hydrolase [Acinetobacter calcoaceticus]